MDNMNVNPNQVPGNDNSQAPDNQDLASNVASEETVISEDTTVISTPAEETAEQIVTEPMATVEQETAPVEIQETKTEIEPVTETVATVEQETAPVEIQETKTETEPVTETVAEKTEEKVLSAQPETIIAEAEEDEEEGEQEIEDISTLTKAELITKLSNIVESKPVHKIYQLVEDIRTRYNEIVEEECEKERTDFVAQGNEEVEFIPSQDPLKEIFSSIVIAFKNKVRHHRERLEKDKEENLKRKYAIIQAIENLINSEESMNKTFNEFHQLQEEWRTIGLVPQSATKHLYETYHHHVERFYDFIKINKELRELDFKKNLEQKLEICEKAESLILEPSVIKAFKTLQDFHKQWREIGPVARDKKEELWERFKEATTKVNQRHHEHYVTLKEDQEKNLDQKKALVIKIQEINKLTLVKPKKWEEKAQEIIEIQKQWKAIGFAPRKENNELFDQFKAECDKFFTTKRGFFDERRKEEQNNFQMKIDLCVQAEGLKDSTEWKKTTEDFIKLQKAWKEIGSVPRKHSEIVWQRFRTACDAFFNGKSQHFGNQDKEQSENLAKKLELIEKVKEFALTGDSESDLQTLSDYQSMWTDIGFVPFDKKDKIQKEFRAALNVHFDTLNVSPRSADSYKGKARSWGDSPKSKVKSNQERNKLVIKIRDLENEIALYENNIGFFSKSANATVMIRDIQNKIERAKQTIVELKNKLEVFDKMDDEA
jgi:hypothetical protein